MDEMGVPQTVDLRRGFKKYRKFFNAQSRRSKVAALCVPVKLSQLQVAIMAALAGLKTARPNAVIKAVLQNGLNAKENPVYQEFVNYGIDEAFWRMVEQGSGYIENDVNRAMLSLRWESTPFTASIEETTSFLSG